MKRITQLLSFFFCLIAVQVNAVVAPTNALPMRIVTCADGTDLDALIAEFELEPGFIYRALPGFAAPMNQVVVENLKADLRIRFVEDDGPISFGTQTNSVGLVRMGVDLFPIARVNGVPKAPIDVDVAVIDSGIDPHPDLNIHHSINMNGAAVNDPVGHGTLVAGILGAIDNGYGIAGVAPGVRIWNIRTGNSWTGVLGAMDYIGDFSNQVSVVNMSVGNPGASAPFNALRFQLQRLINVGMVVVAAAGNDTNDMAGADGIFGNGDDELPASIPLAMSVSAMDSTTDRVAPFSNFSQIERTNNAYTGTTNYVVSRGGAIDVAAPGVNILTTGTNGGYVLATGTSFAAPHVSGLVALYIAANGRATNAAGVYRIRQAIIDAALPQSQWNTTNTMDPDSNPEPLAIASEAWIPKPVITNFNGASNAFQVGFATVPGYNYTVQSTTNLAAPVVWENVATAIATNSLKSAAVTDTNAVLKKFYRLDRRGSVAPPLVVAQPQNVVLPLGSNLTLNARVAGYGPLVYRWHKGGVELSDTGNISGSATASLTVANAQLSDAGDYSLVVTNDFGSVTSRMATVTMLSNWASSQVASVSATATSEWSTRYASNAVNGAIAPGATWESAGVPQGDRAPAITFDLSVSRALERMELWNGPEPGPAAKRFVVEVSSNGVEFHAVSEHSLTSLSPASETIALGGVVARYVRLVFQENGNGQIFPAGYAAYDGTGYIMVDEVQFHEYTQE